MESRNARTASLRPIGAAVLVLSATLQALPALAQGSQTLTPLSLKGVLGDIPTAPVPRDQNGNPIQVQQPSAAELEAARKAEAARLEKIRAEEKERQAAAERAAAEERRAAERLAEEKSFHDRIMNAVYLGLALLAAWIAFRVFKRNA